MTTRWRITICGKVQGVFYRKSTQEKALELGIDGWVHNLENGCVEAEVQADSEVLNALFDWCKIGPPAAEVSHLEKEEISVIEESGFYIRY